MNLTRPSEVRNLLANLAVRPRRAWGQNFLVDANILERLLQSADLRPGDRVLEIGAGLGTVTRALLPRVHRVVAVEKDARLCAYLRQSIGGAEGLDLRCGDALELSFEGPGALAVNKVVANLPYAVGTRILVELIRASRPPEQMVVTVQQEVAERLCARPSTRAYGLLSVWAQLAYDVRTVKRVSASCFWPRPEVASAIVCLRLRGTEDGWMLRDAGFLRATRSGFAQRRKQLAPVLARSVPGTDIEKVRTALRAFGMRGEARAEDVGPIQWGLLVRRLTGADESAKTTAFA